MSSRPAERGLLCRAEARRSLGFGHFTVHDLAASNNNAYPRKAGSSSADAAIERVAVAPIVSSSLAIAWPLIPARNLLVMVCLPVRIPLPSIVSRRADSMAGDRIGAIEPWRVTLGDYGREKVSAE
jgi:hypothetical protein